MNRLLKNPWSIVILLSALQLLVAHLFASQLQSTNPDGVQFFEPEQGGSGILDDAYFVGYSLGLFLTSLTYVAMGVAVFAWGHLKAGGVTVLISPLFSTALLGFIAMVVVKLVAW